MGEPLRIDIPPEGIEYFLPGGTEPVFAIHPGSVEGKATFYFGGSDIAGLRNLQFGQLGVSAGGDISAGGAGRRPDDPRMPLNLAFDNGGLTTIYDGRKHKVVRVTGNDDQTRNLIDLYAPVHLHGPLLIYNSATKRWVRKL